MRKPIFIIYVPGNFGIQGLKDMSKLIEKTKIEDDYYVFSVCDFTSDKIKFEMFSDKKIKPIELDKLKSLLKLKK